MKATDPIPERMLKKIMTAPITRMAKRRVVELHDASVLGVRPIDLLHESGNPGSPLYEYRRWIKKEYNKLHG